MIRLRIGALAAAAAIAFAACGGASSPSPTSGATPAPGSTDTPAPTEGNQPKDGGTLVVALPGDITRTDPALIDDSNSSYVMQQVMEGLVSLAPGSTSDVVPALAESWSLSPDGKTYTFKIRQG